MSKPKIVITAGGSNSRFFPLNTQVHKGAVTLLGTAIINRTLKNLVENGFDEIIIVQSRHDQESGYLEKTVTENNKNLNLKFITQLEPKGMGDAILSCQELIEEQFVIISPYHFSGGDLIKKMMGLGAQNCVCLTETATPWLYGIVDFDETKILGIEEKPNRGQEKSKMRLIGCYLLEKEFLTVLKKLPESEYNFEQALDEYIQRQEVKPLIVENQNLSLKYPWHLFQFQSELFSKMTAKIDPTAIVASTAILDESKGPIIIEAGAKVGDFAKIVGPSYLGKNTLVGDYSFIRQTSLEEGSVVGANTEVVRSIILENSTLHFSYLADSIIGPNNQIGAGLITANKRLNRESINTMVKGVKTDTGLTALGIITGDGAKLGIGLNTMPGVLIGSEAKIFPGLTISKNVEHDETIQRS